MLGQVAAELVEDLLLVDPVRAAFAIPDLRSMLPGDMQPQILAKVPKGLAEALCFLEALQMQ